MVIDIGGGTTDIAVISLGGVVVSESIKVAGDSFDEAIVKYVRRRYNLLIGESSAEQVKRRIGCLDDKVPRRTVEIKGRCLKTGMPKVITLASTEMIEALMEPISAVLDAVRSVIERTPPELVGDLVRNGIVMTGGGSLIQGFDKMVADVTGIKTRRAKDCVACVVRGAGIALDNIEDRPVGVLNLALDRKNNRL